MSDEVKSLKDALDASNQPAKLPQGSASKIDDLSKESAPFLTEKSKTALSKVERRLSILRADAEGRGYVYAQCLCVAARTELNDLEKGIKKVAETINKLAEQDKIVSALTPNFIKFDLSPESTGYFNEDGSPKPLEAIVLCYVHVLEADYQEIMKDLNSHNVIVEGEMP